MKTLREVLQDSDFIAGIEKASYHRAVSVTEEPETVLTRWRAIRVHANFNGKGDSIHFVGYTGYEGRVCSPILSWDRKSMTGVSRSGRVYRLIGEPGYDADADYVLGRWLDRNGSPEWEDVSHEFV